MQEQKKYKYRKYFQSDITHGFETHEKSPDIVYAVVECPYGSRAKYEIHRPSGLLKLDRVLRGAVQYPGNYGEIPGTLSEDGEATDILVLCDQPIKPLTIIESRVIGVMHMTDNGEKDFKIIAVADKDISYSKVNNIDDLPRYKVDQIIRFFRDYKTLEGKVVIVPDDFNPKEEALKIIQDSVDFYNKTRKELIEQIEQENKNSEQQQQQ